MIAGRSNASVYFKLNVNADVTITATKSGFTSVPLALTVYGDRRTRPVGLVHASANLTASALYAASLAARRRGVPGRARLLSLAGESG